MSRIAFSFSLSGLLAFTLFVAFSCAALHYATDLWSSAAVSLSLLLLLLGVTAAIVRPEARPFWIGFALFGLTYFYVSVGPGGATLWPRLVTTSLLEYIEGKLEPASLAPADEVAQSIDQMVQHRLWTFQWPPTSPVLHPGNFQAIGHSAFAILFGLVGGIAGCLVQGRRRHSDSGAQGAQP